MKRNEKQIADLLLGLGILLGPGMILAFWFFLYAGPNEHFNFGLSDSAALKFDFFLSLLFFISHSVLIRKPIRKLASRYFPEQYFGVLFSILSGALLLIIILFWQETSSTIFSAQGFFRSIFRFLYFLCIAGFFWCIWALGSLDPFGLQAMMDHVKGKVHEPYVFTVRGPYRWVRHPIYFIWLIIFWAYPDLTPDRLMLNLLWSAWIIVAAFLEERDLIKTFGETYVEYQKEVPMIIPKTLLPIR